MLEAARDFKTSWIKLGQALSAVWNDKMYKQWGYLTFEGYIAKEIGIRKLTAMKLLRSYRFLEKEEPSCLDREGKESAETATIPGYDAIDVLRLAKAKKSLSNDEYDHVRKNVFENGMDAKSVRKDLSALLRSREANGRPDARTEIKAILNKLRAVHRDLETLKILPDEITDLTAKLIERVEKELRQKP